MKRTFPPVVLTIDDERAIRDSFRNYLEDYDYKVLEAENGRIGLEIIRQNTPDLILVDLRMPEVDGLEVLTFVKQSLPDTPIIVVSGTGVISDVVEALHLGAWDYLLKPIEDLDVLRYAVEQSLERSWLIKQNRLYQEHLEEEVARRTLELKKTNQALSESEERYRSLSENAPIAIMVHYDEQLEYINPEGIRLLEGSAKEDFLGTNVRKFIHPESIEQTKKILKNLHNRLSANGTVESRFISLNGRVLPVEIARTLINYNGREAVQDVFLDISKRVRAEAESKKQFERLNSLHLIDKAITSNDGLDATLKIILTQVIQQLEVDAASVWKFEDPTNELILLAEAGFKHRSSPNFSLRLNRSLAGSCVIQKSMVYVQDVQKYKPELFKMPEVWKLENFNTFIGVPLIARGKVKGVLELFQQEIINRDDEWFYFMNTIAEQVAIAIDNSLILEDLRRSNLELTLAYDTTLEGWAKALEMRDKETEGHSRRVTKLTLDIARSVGMDGEDLIHVRRGTILHDIGKMGISDAILLKEGPLSEEEWEVMRQHPIYAYGLLSTIPFLKPALDIPYCHHEKWDGSGYPRGLKGEQIPLAARIFSLVDVWDALISDRPYRKAWPKEKVVNYIREQSGKHFDPDLVGIFLDTIYPNKK